MNKIYILILLLVVCGYSVGCKKAPKALTKEQLMRQMDSITNVRFHELYQEAQVDLERRITIEVKAKADSIVNAHMLQKQQKKVAPVNAPTPGKK